MESIIKYSINIALEGLMVLVLCFLLLTCFLQKKRFGTTKPLIVVTSLCILLLANQILTWAFSIAYHNHIIDSILPFRIVYGIDFLLFYLVGASFYGYADYVVKDKFDDVGILYKPNVKHQIYLYIWGIIISIIYTIFLFMPWYFRIEEGVFYTNYAAYAPILLAASAPCISAFALAIKSRSIISKLDFTLIVSYVTLPLILLVVDEILLSCISYITLSIGIFILYVHIDLRRGEVIEKQEKNLVEYQTKIALSQMQPHFIYNVLTTISGLCEMENALEARDVVNRFSDYFRVNLDSLGKDKFIPFEKELEHIKTYLWLEKVRFEDSLNVEYEIDHIDFMVPSLAIQPIIENAVKHGIQQKDEPGTVKIITYETPLDNVIVVEDDGVGFNVNEKPNDGRDHVGLSNVKERLKLLCNGVVTIQSEIGKGTVVTIKIPKEGE